MKQECSKYQLHSQLRCQKWIEQKLSQLLTDRGREDVPRKEDDGVQVRVGLDCGAEPGRAPNWLLEF